MPSDRRQYNYRSSRFHLPATIVSRRSRLPIHTEKATTDQRYDSSSKSDPSNSRPLFAPHRIPRSSHRIHSRITLPIPPSINHQYATVNGRRLLSAAGRAYKTSVGQQVWLAFAQSPARCSLRDRLHSGPLALTIRFFFASALRRDLDGGLKIAQDAICEGLGLNDNRIIETHLYKQVDKADPRMEVSLWFLHPPHHSA